MQKSLFSLSLLAAALPALAMRHSVVDGDGVGFSPEGTDATPTASAVMNGKETKYFFKSTAIKDSEGKEIGKNEPHPVVTAVLPYPTAAEIIEKLSHAGDTEDEVDANGKQTGKKLPTLGAKVAALIMEGINDLVFAAGRAQINEFLEKNENNPEARFTPTMFNLERMTLEYIATLERGQRGAWAPSEEDIKGFAEDYTLVMVHTVEYPANKVKVHCDQFAKGFSKIKADKIAVQKMLDFITLWAAHTNSMETNEPVYSWLKGRADKYLKAEEKNFADAL